MDINTPDMTATFQVKNSTFDISIIEILQEEAPSCGPLRAVCLYSIPLGLGEILSLVACLMSKSRRA